MIEQRTMRSQVPAPQPIVTVPLTAEVFLFRQMVADILTHCKKNIKGHPFDDMQVDRLLETNQSRSIDIYHQYFLMGIGHTKTRELVCNRIDRLIRENIINKDNLPAQMVTAIINARTVSATGGGSTASSGSNSVVGSALNLATQKSIEIGKLVATILSCTLQPSSQISVGLLFLLEGTRNKNNANIFTQLIEDTYAKLSKFRRKPIDRFLSHFLSHIASQVEYHEASYLDYQKRYLTESRKSKPKESSLVGSNYNRAPSIMLEKAEQDLAQVSEPPPMHEFIIKQVPYNCKEHLCVHPNEEDSKFGKCFMCDRGANNYDKTLFVPLCSIECKSRLKRINQQCVLNDHFVFVKWVIETLGSSSPTPGTGDQVLYSLLLREVGETEALSDQDIGSIMEIIVNNFSWQALGITNSSQSVHNLGNMFYNKIIENSAVVMSFLVRKYPGIMLRQPSSDIKEEKQYLEPNFHHTKIILLEMVRMLQSLPVFNSPLQLTLLKSLMQILNSKSQQLIVLKELYLRCDCRVLESNLVERIFNVISQYALYANTSSSLVSNQAASLQNLGTSTSLGLDTSANTGVVGNAPSLPNSCVDMAISAVDQLLASIVKVMNQFSTLTRSIDIREVIKQKRVKKHIQTKFVEDFNKKPVKAVDNLRKIFQDKISPKDVAILLRENMDEETRVKKAGERINRQEVGVYFGTAKKEKDGTVIKDFNQDVYWEFLKLQSHEYAGKEVDDCLRITFNSFRMPKQGQQVEVVLGPLSLALEPVLGLKQGKQATATYQLIMIVLMVQTATNPNVKQNEKLKYEDYKKFCAEIDENFSEARMANIYERIKKRPLEVRMQYKNRQVFSKKYLSPQHLDTEFWKHAQNLSILQQRKEEAANSPSLSAASHQEGEAQSLGKKTGRSEESPTAGRRVDSRSSIQMQEGELQIEKPSTLLTFTFLNLWQYVYMTIVNRHNLRGLEQACILYGKCQLLPEFQAFFGHLYRMHQELQERSSSTLQSIGQSAKLIILKLAIDYSNCVIGRQAWLIIIKIIYRLDMDEEKKSKGQSPKKNENFYSSYEYEASDKLFTRTNTFVAERLKEFLEAMCEFSSSEVKVDVKYTREMYILHHIAQIIEYNLSRFEGREGNQEETLWGALWPTIRSYFRNICLHPRRQIAMSAIDSYKQLTMKMVRLKGRGQNGTVEICHTQLMSVYLYIFERSPSYIRDLITNILLNVVCREMKSGWNQLYAMLEVSDGDDKTVVMKVINRLISDVGLSTISNPLRLHQIVLKELRIADEDSRYGEIVEALWHLCEHFDRLDIWLESLSKVKDIYKSCSSTTILRFLYRICNRCIEKIGSKPSRTGETNRPQEDVDRDNLEQIQDELQENYIHQALQQTEEIEVQAQGRPIIDASQANKLIYFEVFSAQMHIMEIKNQRLFVETISIFKDLNLDVFFRNIGADDQNKTGFLPLWEMFISSSAHSVHFCYFLNDYFGLVFQALARAKHAIRKGNDTGYCATSLDHLFFINRQIVLWLVRLFVQTSKDEVIQLSQEDPDLRRTYQQILQLNLYSGNKTELIQFYLSSKQYEAKCIQHLVILKIFKLYFECEPDFSGASQDLNLRVLEVLLQSYDTAVALNNKPLLRNFLWNNEFFKKCDYLPGLMKQEFRSYELMLRYFPLHHFNGKPYQRILDFIKSFIQKSRLLQSKYPKIKQKQRKTAEPNKPQVISSDESQNEAFTRMSQTLYQDLGLWITNSDQLVCLSVRKVCKYIKESTFLNQEQSLTIDFKDLFNLCIELSTVANSNLLLKECSYLLQELVARIY